jgi:hypothetical protein
LVRGAAARRLASARRPLEEAARLAEGVDPSEVGVAVVQGFGVGLHVARIAEKLGRTGVVLVHEPDLGLLRAVLERVDCAAWFERANIAVLHRADAGAISATLRGAEVVLSLGVKVVDHPPSMPRLGESARRFAEAFTTTVRAVRTNVVTTLMQTETSLRNGMMNLDHYASAPGVGELTACAYGRPAVVVSAGPSLRRNLHLLGAPGVRDRVVIIAVQTVLKQVLEAGIRPHFVTALDYHEISRRFYEGLTEADVAGVTLVVEPKANPAILDAFPGAIRCVHDDKLSQLLGPAFAHDGAGLEPGATVAHMAYTLARHMGCDPVILIGQDLGFTDGQYYAPGAAIHNTWACELGEFNTLETMEWQRIVRNRAHLHPATDHLGRPVYTDEQMSAYLVQFERMFEADAAKGLSTIDATEGGVAKRLAPPMKLAEALALHAPADAPRLSLPPTPADRTLRDLTSPRVADRLASLAHDAARIARLSTESAGLLREMLARHDNQHRVNKLIARVQEQGREVQSLNPAYALVQHLNQTGQFKRFKADRLIHLDHALTPLDRQKRQIERDIVNVEWLAEAAGQIGKLLHSAEDALRARAEKLTRDPDEHGADGRESRRRERKRVAAFIPVDTQRGGMGTVRNLAWPVADGRNALQLTLARLCRCEGLDRIVLLTEHPERVRALIGDERLLHAPAMGGALQATGHPSIEIEHTESHPLGERRRGVAAARAFAGHSWRGGLCAMTIWDEVVCPSVTLEAMRHHHADAALLVGPDWVLVDPELTDAVIARYREDPRAPAPDLHPGRPRPLALRDRPDPARRAGGQRGQGRRVRQHRRAARLHPPLAHPRPRRQARLRARRARGARHRRPSHRRLALAVRDARARLRGARRPHAPRRRRRDRAPRRRTGPRRPRPRAPHARALPRPTDRGRHRPAPDRARARQRQADAQRHPRRAAHGRARGRAPGRDHHPRRRRRPDDAPALARHRRRRPLGRARGRPPPHRPAVRARRRGRPAGLRRDRRQR